MNLSHVKIRIYGRVQGVSFRAAVRAQARALGVTGFVQNEADGTVYVEAEGTPRSLEQLVAWCRTGKPPALVEAVTTKEGEIQHFHDFSIRY